MFSCGPLGGAVARAFPLFSRKTKSVSSSRTITEDDKEKEVEEEEDTMVHVTFLDSNGKIVKDTKYIEAAKAAAEGVRLACRLVGEFCFFCVAIIYHLLTLSYLIHCSFLTNFLPFHI